MEYLAVLTEIYYRMDIGLSCFRRVLVGNKSSNSPRNNCEKPGLREEGALGGKVFASIEGDEYIEHGETAPPAQRERCGHFDTWYAYRSVGRRLCNCQCIKMRCR